MRGGGARVGVEDVLASKATGLWKSSGQCNGPVGALPLMDAEQKERGLELLGRVALMLWGLAST
jgi:hypothetical protein